MNDHLRLVVDDTDPVPAYAQLCRQLTDLIHSGVLPPGARLPALRQLAGDLGLAVGTVARAYRELEVTGLITAHRGGGTRVAADPRTPDAERVEQALLDHATHYVRHARHLGMDPDHILRAVRNALTTYAR